jgi:hypothetical protein
VRKRAGLVAFVAASLALAGCGSGEDSLSGVWTGAFRDTLGGLGGGSFTFSQSGAEVQGSWQVIFETFAGHTQYNNSGSVVGSVTGDLVTAQMTSQSSCVFAFQGTRSGRHLSGSYQSSGCAVPQSGTVDLEKE